MGIEYREGSVSVPRFEPRRARFVHAAILIVLAMAAIPAALGILQQVGLGIAARLAATGGENAAAATYTSGNQPPKPALADGAQAVSAAKGDLLALCSGTPGASVNARRYCTSLAEIIQH